SLPYDCISKRIAAELETMVGVEARSVVPGHIQRGGSPSAYDRVLSTQFGAHAAELIRDEHYGVTVALSGSKIIHNDLKDIASVPKPVPKDDIMVITARSLQ
ncbi:MAG: 6-phosphofructokinase, partial [Clostridia bacterium]